VDDEHVHTFAARVGVGAEAREVVHVVLEGFFFERPDLLFRLVEVIDEIANKKLKAGFVETSGKGLANEGNGLASFHAKRRLGRRRG